MVITIEESRERQVTSYLCQWTQLTRLQRQIVAPVQPFSYGCTGATPRLCGLVSCVHWHRYDVTCRSLPSSMVGTIEILKCIEWQCSLCRLEKSVQCDTSPTSSPHPREKKNLQRKIDTGISVRTRTNILHHFWFWKVSSCFPCRYTVLWLY